METPKGYDVFRLVDGTEVLRSPEDRVLFQRISSEGMPLTVDAETIIDDVLDTLKETNSQIELLSDSLNRIEQLLTDDLSSNAQAINHLIFETRLKVSEGPVKQDALKNELEEMRQITSKLLTYGKPRSIFEWHEDDGDVLWWQMPVNEPPYCGTPLDLDWPGYHTYWTPLIVPID
ncbi:hypothetical protein ABIE27_004059 [Paenibacillus sp. 4624]|uniref:hypothetical protein n=1 Tax=Paenibacillus sp. 4624 TaxID=3156453 RepID=UPI003D244656